MLLLFFLISTQSIASKGQVLLLGIEFNVEGREIRVPGLVRLHR